MTTAAEVISVLDSRASRYGGSASDLIERTPSILWDNPDEILSYWDLKDLSHIYPQSTHPELAEVWGNIIAEDYEVNRARRDKIMTDTEIEDALEDNELDAIEIDSQLDGDSDEFLEELLDALTE